MSRQRNVEKPQHETEPVIEQEDTYSNSFKPAAKKQSNPFNLLQIDSETDVIQLIPQALKLALQITYNFTPFVLLLYLYQIYISPLAPSLYYPDFPNSFRAASQSELNEMNVEFYDLADYASTANGWQNNERVLFLVPLRDASAHLPMFFSHLNNLTYPHHLVDLAFLISDTSDSTIEDLDTLLSEFQNNPDKSKRFGRIEIFEKDFGQIVGQSFSDRHGFAAQGPRRKKMGIARNWLLSTALRPDHSWVYWRDIDVETCPSTVLEDLMHHDKDVIVPNIWRPLPDWLGYEQAYDLNSWQESEGGIELAERLDEDAVIVEGYPEYATWRPHLAYLRDPYGDPEVEIELDGIGGVSILSKAHVFRRGAMFPAFSFKKHAETEAFGKLCKTMGFEVIGLPHYVIWHIYEPSTDDLKHMEWLANEEIRQKEHLKNKIVFDRAWELAFEDVSEQWEQEKFDVFKNTDLTSLNLGKAHWDDVDEYLTEVDDDEYDQDNDANPDDNGFFMNFNSEKNKLFEKNVLNKLKSGPVAYGDSRNEFIFDNFNDLEGSQKRKKMKFKKFDIVEEAKKAEQKSDNNNDEAEEYLADQLEGKYDLASDQIIKDADSKNLINDKTINNDKQLFDDLESNKIEIDGEEEGGVEFKEQQLVEEAEAEAKIKKQLQKKKKSIKKVTAITKTLYEVDEEGFTVATVIQTVKPRPSVLAAVEHIGEFDEEEEAIEDEKKQFEEILEYKKLKKINKKQNVREPISKEIDDVIDEEDEDFVGEIPVARKRTKIAKQQKVREPIEENDEEEEAAEDDTELL